MSGICLHQLHRSRTSQRARPTGPHARWVVGRLGGAGARGEYGVSTLSVGCTYPGTCVARSLLCPQCSWFPKEVLWRTRRRFLTQCCMLNAGRTAHLNSDSNHSRTAQHRCLIMRSSDAAHQLRPSRLCPQCCVLKRCCGGPDSVCTLTAAPSLLCPHCCVPRCPS